MDVLMTCLIKQCTRIHGVVLNLAMDICSWRA